MKKLIDITNFNADASCLSTEKWLQILSGGEQSLLMQFLQNYVFANKKVSLGFTGATISDIVNYNRVAIEYVNSNSNIFEIIIRPYTHDISILRSNEGFDFNLTTGRLVIEKEFTNIANWYLPPEFMFTNEQIKLTADFGLEGTFINANRFKPEIRKRIPNLPYYVSGVDGAKLKCIPVEYKLTNSFLTAIQTFNINQWNNAILKKPDKYSFSWRDGESLFLLPKSINRESFWLANESADIERCFIKDIDVDFEHSLPDAIEDNLHYKFYPIHSFHFWLKEFRMLNYVQQIKELENRIFTLSNPEKYLWLQTINSDILSSIEKDSPVIKLKANKEADFIDFIIWRAEKNIEGEEYLSILNNYNKNIYKNHFEESTSLHIQKLGKRVEYLEKLFN